MKESIANSYIFNFILVFVGIIIVLLIGSLSYSRVFKIKTRIISIIENNDGYNETVRNEIESYLKSTGYKVTGTNSTGSCPTVNGNNAINDKRNYDYCIYKFDTNRGPYYRVTVFISYDIPFISSYLRIPMSGESRIIYEVIDA